MNGCHLGLVRLEGQVRWACDAQSKLSLSRGCSWSCVLPVKSTFRVRRLRSSCGVRHPPRPPPRRHGRPPSPQCWLSAERGSEGQSLSLGISLSGGDRMKFFCGARSCAFNHLTAISRLPPLPQVLVRQRAVHETAPSSSPSSQQAGGGVGWCPQGVWAP